MARESGSAVSFRVAVHQVSGSGSTLAETRVLELAVGSRSTLRGAVSRLSARGLPAESLLLHQVRPDNRVLRIPERAEY